MKETYCDINILLDKSRSMEWKTNDVIDGFNKFISEQREVKGEARVSLYLFDNDYHKVFKDVDLKLVKTLTVADYTPKGSTSLWYSMGTLIDEMGVKYNEMRNEHKPHQIILFCMTDGQENTSHLKFPTYDAKRVASMIAHQREKYSWNILFSGSDEKVINQDAAILREIKVCGGIHNYNNDVGNSFEATSRGTRNLRNSVERLAKNFYGA